MYFFYYLPIGIDAETKRFPLATVGIAAGCVAVFVGARFFSAELPFSLHRWIYFPGFSSPVTALSAAFLHFDYFHIVSNLVYLLLFGRYLEDRIGTVAFAVLFAVTAVIGNLAQGWYNLHALHTNAGIIGASGAVSGLMGAFLVRLRYHNVRIAYWVFAPLMAVNRAGRAEMHVVFAMALWVLIQIVRGLVQLEGAAASVAYVTHVGGFVAGVAAMVLTGGWQQGSVEGHLVRAKRYLRRGEYYGAQDELARYAAARPFDGEAHAALARASLPCGDREGAHAAYRTACERLLASAHRGRAESVFVEASRAYDNFVLGAEAHLDLAYGLERNLKPPAALKAYENFARVYDEHAEAAFALLRAANLHARAGNLDRARFCYERLVTRYPSSEWTEFATEHARRLAVS